MSIKINKYIKYSIVFLSKIVIFIYKKLIMFKIMYKLDIKDKKLLYELDKDCRQSYSQLGRKLKLSKGTIKYRIDNLKEEGIIKGFHTIINIGKIGYTGFRLYLNLQDTTPTKEKEIILFLKKKNNITWLASMDGKYNLGAFIVAKSINEIEELWTELLEKYINYFDERLFTILMRSNYFSMAHLVGMQKNDYEIIATTTPDLTVDEKDKLILKILSADATAPIIDIARKTGMTSKTVIERIKKLEQKNVILGYKTFLNLDKAGLQHFKVHFILLKVSKEKEREFKEYFKIHPNVVYREKHIGGDDIEIGIQAEDNNVLRKILDEIRERFADIIHEYSIHHIYEEHKSTYFIIE